ncbi:Serine/threonine phosphatase stp [Planctomycetes bacterium Pan216]|uniref:Serine/threonine phosphatase stp n=1 Tax=Kolteria novifilia TaxID=2527975 RepID=A0A518BCT1_9BACT|nr:Serine/threonine phosphatase stp [Planctomycetes bacterium Pan216]
MSSLIDCHGATDIGRVRDTNQDRLLIADVAQSYFDGKSHSPIPASSDPSPAKLLVIADGVGGVKGGETASQIAVQTIGQCVHNLATRHRRIDASNESSFVDDLRHCLTHCQASMDDCVAPDAEDRGMGTTITMAYLLWPKLFVVHAGDSRCYLMRNAVLRRLTRDHNLAEKLIEEGELDLEEAESSHLDMVLWNVVGPDREVKPDVETEELFLGDTLLLCSDGLTKHVTDASIAEILRRQGSAETICKTLIAEANRRGGTDNVTVIAARCKRDWQPMHPSIEDLIEDDEPGSSAVSDTDTIIINAKDLGPRRRR